MFKIMTGPGPLLEPAVAADTPWKHIHRAAGGRNRGLAEEAQALAQLAPWRWSPKGKAAAGSGRQTEEQQWGAETGHP